MLKLISPAKVNLFLKVNRRREDGYHEISSLFQTIDLYDSMQFALSKDDLLESSDPQIPTDHSNLILKAVDLYRRKTGNSFGLHVKIDKRIPISAGLGGGSSNAATTLWGINRLLGCPVSELELQCWSSEIGSDVPFFFSTGTAYCTGRGEQVRSLTPIFPQSLWIFKPHYGLSTPQVYQRLNLSSLSHLDGEEVLKQFLNHRGVYFNDLEESAFSIKPELRLFKENLLEKGFKIVMLSGSGSSFICFGDNTTVSMDCFQFHGNYLNRPLNAWFGERS